MNKTNKPHHNQLDHPLTPSKQREYDRFTTENGHRKPSQFATCVYIDIFDPTGFAYGIQSASVFAMTNLLGYMMHKTVSW